MEKGKELEEKGKGKELEKPMKRSSIGGIANGLLNHGNKIIVENSNTYEQLRKHYESLPRSGDRYNDVKKFKEQNLDNNAEVKGIDNYMKAANLTNRIITPKVTDVEPKDPLFHRTRASGDLKNLKDFKKLRR